MSLESVRCDDYFQFNKVFDGFKNFGAQDNELIMAEPVAVEGRPDAKFFVPLTDRKPLFYNFFRRIANMFRKKQNEETATKYFNLTLDFINKNLEYVNLTHAEALRNIVGRIQLKKNALIPIANRTLLDIGIILGRKSEIAQRDEVVLEFRKQFLDFTVISLEADGKEIQVPTSSACLEKLEWYTVFKARRDMKKIDPTVDIPEGASTAGYVKVPYSKMAIENYLSIRRCLAHAKTIVDFALLKDIYKVADFFNDTEVKIALADQIITRPFFKEFEACKLAVEFALPVSDPLMSYCCKFILNNFEVSYKSPHFTSLGYDFMIRILESESLGTFQSEQEVFEFALEWAIKQVAENKFKSIQEAFYKKLITREVRNGKVEMVEVAVKDVIRFELFDSRYFAKKIDEFKFLDDKDQVHWLKAYSLGVPPTRKGRCNLAYNLIVNEKSIIFELKVKDYKRWVDSGGRIPDVEWIVHGRKCKLYVSREASGEDDLVWIGVMGDNLAEIKDKIFTELLWKKNADANRARLDTYRHTIDATKACQAFSMPKALQIEEKTMRTEVVL